MSGENVVSIVVKSTDDTAAGFGAAKASADEAGAGMEEYAAAVDKATEAQARFDAAQKEQADAAGQLAALQKDNAASADELAAAQQRLTGASLAAADARKKLAAAEKDVAAQSKIASDEQVAAGLKSDEAAAESGGALAGLGSKAKMAFLGVAVGAGVAVKAAMDYQEQSTQLVTGAGELKSNLKMVEQGMLDLSVSTATSTSQMESGMYMIESAGYHGADGLKVLQAAAEGAKVGGADLGTVADGLTTVLTDYKLKASDAASATSGLIATVAAGKTHMQDLAGSLSRVLPTAAALKVPFDQIGGAMATMTAQGVTAHLAATHLNSTLLAMANPSATAAKAMQSVGLSSAEVANKLRSGGLVAALQMVTDAAGKKFPAGSAGYVAAVDKMLGGQSGLSVALQLTGSHLKDLKANTDSVAKSMKSGSGEVQGWNETQKDTAFQLAKAKAAVSAMGIELGSALLPAMTAVLKPLSDMLGFIAHNKVAADAFAAVVGGVLAGALGGKLAGAFKDLKSGVEGFGSGIQWVLGKLGLMTTATEAQTAATEAGTAATEEADAAMSVNPIMLIVGAIALLAVGIYELVKHWHAVEDAFKTAFRAVKDAVLDAVNFIKSHWELLLAILTGPIGLAVLFIKDHWDKIRHDTAAFADDVVKTVKNLADDIVKTVTKLATDVGHFFESMWDDLFEREKRGITTIIDTAKRWYDNFSNVVYRLKEDVINFFKQMFDRVTGDVRNWESDVVHWFEELPGKVINALSKLPGMMFTAGKNVIKALLDGIKSMIGEVGHVVGSIASKVAGFFGLSPAKEGPLSGGGAPEIRGQHFVADIAKGMRSGLPSVASAARSVAGAAALGAGGGAAGGSYGYAALGGGPMKIQLEFSGGHMSGLEGQFWTWLQQGIRVRGGDPSIIQRKVQFKNQGPG
jgi:TP901 family phage tail tape measure protein